jgi:hypothetical protein
MDVALLLALFLVLALIAPTWGHDSRDRADELRTWW